MLGNQAHAQDPIRKLPSTSLSARSDYHGERREISGSAWPSNKVGPDHGQNRTANALTVTRVMMTGARGPGCNSSWPTQFRTQAG